MRDDRRKLLTVTIALVTIGIVMVYSTTGVLAALKKGDSAYFLKKHSLHVALGIIGMLSATLVDMEFLKKNARRFLYAGIIMLLLAFTGPFGREVGGAKRWLCIAGVSFQPVEFCKIALIIYIASLTSRKKGEMCDFHRGFVPFMVIIGMVVLPVLAQPDFGTAVFLWMLASVLLICAGMKFKYWVTSVFASLPFLYFLIYSVPYRWARIKTFINPWEDPRGDGFQIIQSFIALGSGGLSGVGLGHSRQKLLYLPEAHTDFIYSIIGEELGFAGSVGVLVLFALFAYYAWQIAAKAPDTFSFYLAFGIVMMISMEAAMNIAVVTGSMPTKGLPLPFISFGGSSLAMHLAGVGLLFAVSRHSEKANSVER